MALYRVLVRRAIMEEAEVVIEAGGRKQAEQLAEVASMGRTTEWKSLHTVEQNPYAVASEKVS